MRRQTPPAYSAPSRRATQESTAARGSATVPRAILRSATLRLLPRAAALFFGLDALANPLCDVRDEQVPVVLAGPGLAPLEGRVAVRFRRKRERQRVLPLLDAAGKLYDISERLERVDGAGDDRAAG